MQGKVCAVTHLQGVEEAKEAPAQLRAHLWPAARVQEHLPRTPNPSTLLVASDHGILRYEYFHTTFCSAQKESWSHTWRL